MENANDSIYIKSDFKNNETYFRIHYSPYRELTAYHNHDFLQIWYVSKGSFPHIIHGKEYTHSAGDLLIVPPYMPHQFDTRNADDFELIAVNLGDNFLNLFPDGIEKNLIFNLTCLRPLIYNASNANPFLHFSPEVSEKIENLLLSLYNEYENSSNLSPIYLRADLVRLLALIAEEYSKNMPQKEDAVYSRYRIAIQDALDYINKNYTNPLSREDICKIALMSPSTFSYVFAQTTGRTFVEYVHSLRIRLAKKLFLETDKSVTEVCIECGFGEVTHFGRIFKKMVGYSPRQFIKLEKSKKDVD